MNILAHNHTRNLLIIKLSLKAKIICSLQNLSEKSLEGQKLYISFDIETLHYHV